jgi:hypothetical protein
MAERVRCNEHVYDSGRFSAFHPHRCSRWVWDEHPEEGKCKVHHSISVAERRKKSEEAWEKKKTRDPWYLWQAALGRIKELEAQLAEVLAQNKEGVK